ncbi:glycoside hydrolase family 108 protein [Uliginosibacterium sediminicola]|uniref:Glycosyl hydrolase 108 family protein n=1 Tax=Uliginosibacterium sediminicola TaxID=2024550 RepID=A0ABU9YWN0_9RHOO
MADFNPAFDIMIRNEGGYQLTNVAGDRGGQTYAGIARNMHPEWPGWRIIDRGDMGNLELSQLVRDFYKANYWDRVSGDGISRQAIAESIFDFAVNAGPAVAAKLAQLVVGAVPDGRIGPKTLDALNALEEGVFVLKYAIAKVARYAEICNKDRSQSKFLLGWINRTMKGLA